MSKVISISMGIPPFGGMTLCGSLGGERRGTPYKISLGVLRRSSTNSPGSSPSRRRPGSHPNKPNSLTTSLNRYILTTGFIILFASNGLSLSEQYYYHTRDSLQNLVYGTSGTARADAIFQLVSLIVPYEPELADSLIKEELALSEKLGYQNGIDQALQNRGDYYYQQEDYARANEHYYNAIYGFEEIQNYREAANTMLRVSHVFEFTGKSINPEDNKKMLRYYEITASWDMLAVSYLLTGYYYNNHDRLPDSSKKYHRLAIRTAKKAGLSNLYLSAIYISAAMAFRNAGEYDSSAQYLYMAKNMLTPDNTDEAQALTVAYIDLASTHLNSGNLDSAIYYSRKTIDLSRQFSYLYLAPRASLYISRVLVAKNRLEEALPYGVQAVEGLQEILSTGRFYKGSAYPFAAEWLLDAYPGFMKTFSRSSKRKWARGTLLYVLKDVIKLYKMKGDDARALEYYELYHAHSDTMRMIENEMDLYTVQLNHQAETKNREIEDLAQQNRLQQLQIRQTRIILFGLGGIILLGIFITILLIRQGRIRNEQEKSNLQQKLFRMQMNPHFIFNSLSSIQGFIMDKDHKTANRYLSRFARLVRNILDYSAEETVPLDKEISTIENYLELQKVRYEGKFDYRIEVDENIEPETIEIPPMLSQPFIENSIEHGIKNLEKKGNILVRFNLQKNKLILEIQDDGIGREKAQELLQQRDAGHRSLATRLTADRITAINKRRKDKIRFEVIDLKENGIATGTKVRFMIPV